ncbi:MAG: YitT family protein, partial [Clostridia bacterium]|nr:YitT family protein [Clostridia bacterium]
MKNKSPSKQQVLQFLKDNLLWVLGCSIYSISLNCFAVPNNIAQSGISGLAIVVNYLFKSFSLGTINFVLNLPLLLLAFVFIGKAFVGKTLWVVALLSAALDIWGKILPVYKGDDKLLIALISGLLSGIGLALVIMTGTTTGGTVTA